LFTFHSLLQNKPNLKVVALAELQETSALPCDTGHSVDQLREEFKDKPVDFSFVPEDWNKKDSGRFAPSTDLISGRAREIRQTLRSRDEKDIAVVTHGGFLHFLTDDWVGGLTGCGKGQRSDFVVARCDTASTSIGGES
jgi:broad specificity phosphatase PhoE